MRKGHIGGSLNGLEFSPQRKKQRAAARLRQEAAWAAKRPSWDRCEQEPAAPDPAVLAAPSEPSTAAEKQQ